MTDSTDPNGETTRALLERHGLRAKKSWGQNFLHDERVVDRIVSAAQAGPGDVVVEIGAGTGALTRRLAATGCHVVAIERDPDLIPVLKSQFAAAGNVDVVAADALTFDLAAAAQRAGRPLIVLGNLPYQITSPLLFRIVDAAAAGAVVARAILMVQKEVAERIVARPGGKIYGRLSVMVQATAAAKILFHVGAGAFLPPPSVTSTVFSITPLPRPVSDVPVLFAAVVRAAFAGRRKMLRRSLAPVLPAADLARAFVAAGVAETRRAEELSVADFARLCVAFAAAGANPGALLALPEDDDGGGQGVVSADPSANPIADRDDA